MDVVGKGTPTQWETGCKGEGARLDARDGKRGAFSVRGASKALCVVRLVPLPE